MKVDVRVFGPLRLNSGKKGLTLELAGPRVRLREILKEVAKVKGLEELEGVAKRGFGDGAPFIILVDGRNCLDLQGLDTEVGEGQKVSIFPPSAGG
ncbi:MAG: MoaD/ThiS family protein [Thermodesulfobacteria bacterium]|nr:MoaD/ThiS family protein [Thermodesulfobacteriota bacterium]